MARLTQKQKGILLMILSALLFSSMQIAVRLSGGRIPVMEQVFFRNSISLIVAFILIRRNHLSVFGPRKYQKWLFGRSFFGFLGVITVFYASNNAAQADVAILSKLSPFLVTLFAVIFLKEKLSKIQIPALLLAFGGAVLVANPSFNSNLWPLAMAFISSVTSGVAYTLLSYFKDKVDALTVIMHFSTFSMVASIPFMLADFVWPTPFELVCLLAIGLFGSFGQICLTYAYRMAPASEVSVYNYAGIPFSMVLGFLFLGEGISPTSLAGGALVVAASVMVYLYSGRKARTAQIQDKREP